MSALGDAVIAIGVFDGVHVGHRSLLRDTVSDARALGVASVAVTFDRDPDQVVAPDTAAPQLLSLADKLRFIEETGVDNVLVIPFTKQVAEMAPEAFVDSVLLMSLRPLAIHVGRDFRFGSRATGDVGTLERAGMARGFRLIGHDLIGVDGRAVTSTRIRQLVADGDVVSATRLLGRPTRIYGVVRRGRGEGASLGFPTANVAPDPYAALPTDGVYAGRVVLEDGMSWAAAISVGTPPSFPEARDYLEAHLIGFEGDLYDSRVTIEFFERLRDQMPFSSLAELTSAISADVERALDIAGFVDSSDAPDDLMSGDEADGPWNPNPFSAFIDSLIGPADDVDLDDETLPDGSPLVADRAALEAAERAVRTGGSSGASCASCEQNASWLVPGTVEVDFGTDDMPVDDPELLACAEEQVRSTSAQDAEPVDWDSWVPLLAEQPYDRGRLLGFQHALDALGIPVQWEPFPPAETPLLKRGFFHQDRFTLAVPEDRFDEARQAIQDESHSDEW